MGQAVGDEHVEGDDGDEDLDNDFRRLEPVEPLAAGQRQLKAGDGEGDQDEAGPFQLDLHLPAHARQGEEHGDRGADRHRHQDVERITPGVGFRHHAADHRAHEGPHDDADPVQADDHAVLVFGKDVEDHRLTHGRQGGAAGPLDDAPEDQRLEGIGRAAEIGGDAEHGQACDQQVAPPEAAGQPARQRRRHGRGQDVEGHRPGDFIGRRRHGALKLRQNRRHDEDRGRVEGDA